MYLNMTNMVTDLLKGKKQQSAKQKNSSSVKYSQDFIDVEDIASGLIIRKDGTVCKILEIVPLNYSEKTDAEKDMIADSFGYAFKQFPANGQIKIMDSKANLDSFINKLRQALYKETDEMLRTRLDDYIENTTKLQKYNSTKKRFFFIFSYEGDPQGKKSTNFTEIYTEMSMQTALIANAFSSCGNIVINADDDDMYEAEILYSFFNPKSFDAEGIERRIEAIKQYRAAHQTDMPGKMAPTADFLAARGLSFKKYDSMLMDGTYHTFLTLKDNSFPQFCNAEWVRTFLYIDPECDIDIHYKQLPAEAYTYLTERTSVIASGIALNFQGDKKKEEESMEVSNNAEYIHDALTKKDEDFYVVNLMITLRAASYKELQSKKAMFLKKAKSFSFYFDECFMMTQDFFKMAMPLNDIVPAVFNPGKRNMTTSSLASLYCFTSYEMFDSDGFCMGICSNSSLFSINPFDTKLFVNPHFFIAGTSGAGKSYTEMMLASRMRLSGVRTMFILPLKGHEYRDVVTSLGGSFITLVPGGKCCLNIMEIRPEAKEEEYVIYDDEDEREINSPLLSKKITSLLAFISLLIGEDIPYDVEGLLNVAISDVYFKYGITNDNDSIYENKTSGKLKKMPIIGDLYEEIKDDPKLERITDALKAWVYGNCSNMNGQTNVNLENKTLAFNVDEEMIGERLLPAFMYLAFDTANSIAKRDVKEKCAMILDEVWKLLLVPYCAKLVFKAIKINRSYNCSCISATQDIEDCTHNEFGRSIITISAIKAFLKCSKPETEQLNSAVSLSEEDCITLISMNKGQGYICFNREKVHVQFISSLLEEALYNTNPSKKRSKWLEFMGKSKNSGNILKIWNKLLTPLGITSATYY